MKVFGYSDSKKDTLLELSEVTFSSNAESIRELASFLIKCADEMEEYGDSWEHEHFSSEKAQSVPDIIVFNSESQE